MINKKTNGHCSFLVARRHWHKNDENENENEDDEGGLQRAAAEVKHVFERVARLQQ
jgi:hypothetical protein